MKTAFFVSSNGDTNLALSVIQELEKSSEQEALLIYLNATLDKKINDFASPILINKLYLPKLLGEFQTDMISEVQCSELMDFLQAEDISQVFIGVPSLNNKIPMQIAQSIEHIPVFMGYEFMFKPEGHCVWEYLEELNKKNNIHWLVPLANARKDFGERAKVIGHLSIDNAQDFANNINQSVSEIKSSLLVAEDNAYTFITASTQRVEVDKEFIASLLQALILHPEIQVRFGLHPGIFDLDNYLQNILEVYSLYPTLQFKIILSENFIQKCHFPELTINNPDFDSVFIREQIKGDEAFFAADRVAQAVPGAYPNQAIIEGKPSYVHEGAPYLPREYFSQNLHSFFTAENNGMRNKQELGLDEKTTAQRCVEIMLNP